MAEKLFSANCLAGYFLGDHPLDDAYRAALGSLAAAGFATTEISHPGLLPLRNAPEIRDDAGRVGIQIRAVHAPPMRRDPTLARQLQAARLAAELGATVLIVHVSSLRFASPDLAVRSAARERDLRRLDLLAGFCLPLGVTLGLENGKHPGHAAYLLALLDALGSTEPHDWHEFPYARTPP